MKTFIQSFGFISSNHKKAYFEIKNQNIQIETRSTHTHFSSIFGSRFPADQKI